MKKIFFIAILLCFTQSAFALQKVVVLLDWFLNPSHAPLFVAQQKGFFKQQGLDVELIGPSDPADPPKLVAANKADIAISYQPQFLEQVQAGLPLIMLGTLIDKPLNCLVTLKTSNINSITDLRNKRIGYSGTGLNNVALAVMLKHNGLTLQDVTAINIHYDLSQALLTKQVDAVTGMMRTFETLQLSLAGHPVNVFYPEDNGMPNYSELIFEVNKNRAQDPTWQKFLTAVNQGSDYLQKHPSQMWAEFAKLHPELNDELNHRAWFATLPDFAKDSKALDKQQFLKFAEFMQKNGLIKQVEPISRYVIF